MFPSKFPPRISPVRLGLLLSATFITIAIIHNETLFARLNSSLFNPVIDPRFLKPPPVTLLPTRTNWEFSKTPDFCKTIVKNPIRRLKCDRNRDTQKCPDGQVTMMSQYAQDYYLYTRHFSRLKRRGVYVDIATNDATMISNTYFIDACLGWDGVCVEANPRYFGNIKKYRSCRLVDTCVSDKEGEKVKFIMGAGLGGISETNKNREAWLMEKKKEAKELSCRRMSNVLKESNVSVIDYLSLDVEGHELKVLQGFDWERVMVNVMTVEGKGQRLEEISKLLSTKGYVRHIPTLSKESIASGKLWKDSVFVHESVTFGDPR